MVVVVNHIHLIQQDSEESALDSSETMWVLAAGVPTVPGSNGSIKERDGGAGGGVFKVTSVGKISA